MRRWGARTFALCVGGLGLGCGDPPAPAATTSSGTSADSGSGPATGLEGTGSAPSSSGSSGSPVEPLFDRGFIVPPNSVPCIPVDTGVPQDECNHHGSTVTELPDGSIAAVWYHGEFEKSVDSRVIWSSVAPGGTEWSAPQVVVDDPERSEGNPAIWVTEAGEILVFFVSIYEDEWHETKIRLVRSSDMGETWSDPVVLRDDFCWNTRQKPLRKADGETILPLYLECTAIPMFMYSRDDFRDDVRWVEFEDMPDKNTYFLAHLGQIQPSLIQRDDGQIVALTRNGTGDGYIKRMVGDPSGMQWEPSQPIDLPNSGTSIDQVRLHNGHVVVIFNNSPVERFPLAAALSVDEGETFTAVRHLDDTCDRDSCQYHYPSVAQASDGSVWVTYTHNRETIAWVHFNESWLAEGGETPVLP